MGDRHITDCIKLREGRVPCSSVATSIVGSSVVIDGGYVLSLVWLRRRRVPFYWEDQSSFMAFLRGVHLV